MATDVHKITGDVTVNVPEVCVRHTEQLPSGSDVTVDFSEVGEVDSTCCAMMVMMQRTTQVNDRKVTFVNLPEKLSRLVELYDLNKVLGLQS